MEKEGGEETDDQIYRYFAELRNEEEARKIEVQLHQNTLCKYCDKWINICFPFYVFVSWMHNYSLDYLYRIMWSLEGLCGICECRSKSQDGGDLRKAVDEIKDQGHQAKENRSVYFQQVDHNIIRKIKLGKIYSLFIHLSWVSEEDNSGGFSSLSKD